MSSQIIVGDCRTVLPTLDAESVQCVVTSPPYYGLRDYGVDGQIGLERTVEEFIDTTVSVFSAVRRLLKPDGTLWLNLGDSYANDGKWGGSSGGKHAAALHGDTGIGRAKRKTGLKPKDLIGIPWRVALALQAEGWYLRQDIIWHKPNPMPESVTDRCTKSHEYLFLLTKSPRYYYDANAIRQQATSKDRRVGRSSHALNDHSPNPRKGMRSSDPERFGLTRGKVNQPCSHPAGKNRRSVWTIATRPYPGAHFATFPPALVEPCVLAGSRAGDVVFDPFAGAGTTGLVAVRHGRSFVGVEVNPTYAAMAEARIHADAPLLDGAA